MVAKGNDAKLFARGKTHELRSELTQQGRKDKNHSAKKIALKRIVANMTMNNNDMIMLFSEVLQCMSIPSLEIKKMSFLYLVHYAKQKSDQAIRAIPILEQDTRDDNPLIRALALRTLSYIPVEAFAEASISAVRKLTRDPDAYVRKTSAYAIAKVYEHNQKMVEKAGVIESLNAMLQDDNPTVVSSALAGLMDIWERNDTIKLTIDYSNASKIVHIMPDCSEWGQIYILEALTCYVPVDCTEATILAERIAPRLSHTNSSVVLTSIRVILYFMNYIEDQTTITILCQKLSPPLVTLLSKGPEIQYLTLRNALLILHRRPEVLKKDIRVFFCKYNDPIYVKVTKLELIYLLANEDNISEVLTELSEYATEIDVDFVRKSVRVIGKLAIKLESAARLCINALLELVESKVSYIVQETTVVVKDIFRRYPNQYESSISKLCENLDDLDEPEAKAAMIWIIGEYADRIENSHELLEDFLETFLDENTEVQLTLLTAVVKLFLKRPAKAQDIVPKVLKWATEESDNPDIRDRGYMYWRLLLHDLEAAKQVVLATKPPITSETELVEPFILEELCLVIGSIVTIYLKPIRSVFRSARVRRLYPSAALQQDDLPTIKAMKQDILEHNRAVSRLPVGSPVIDSSSIDNTQISNASFSQLTQAGEALSFQQTPAAQSPSLQVPQFQPLAPMVSGNDLSSVSVVPHPALSIDPGRSNGPQTLQPGGQNLMAQSNSIFTPTSPAGSPFHSMLSSQYSPNSALPSSSFSALIPNQPGSMSQMQMDMLQMQFQAQQISNEAAVAAGSVAQPVSMFSPSLVGGPLPSMNVHPTGQVMSAPGSAAPGQMFSPLQVPPASFAQQQQQLLQQRQHSTQRSSSQTGAHPDLDGLLL